MQRDLDSREQDWSRNPVAISQPMLPENYVGKSTSELLELGDSAAIDELLNRYRPLLRAIIASEIDPRLQAKADPSDLVQDVCVEVVRSFSRIEAKKRQTFLAYLRQVVLSQLTDLQRRYSSQKRNVLREQGSLDDSSRRHSQPEPFDGLDHLIHQELMLKARGVIATLPEEIQKLIALRFFADKTYAEIGQMIDRNEDDVRLLLKRFLVRIRQQIQGDGPSD